ncbi:MAG TPA: hypothetical protein PLC99_14045 [Verrucomicrobiota bacterium]|nr:hypothetical protein [Verrucomicrobiota bacterium]
MRVAGAWLVVDLAEPWLLLKLGLAGKPVRARPAFGRPDPRANP